MTGEKPTGLALSQTVRNWLLDFGFFERHLSSVSAATTVQLDSAEHLQMRSFGHEQILSEPADWLWQRQLA